MTKRPAVGGKILDRGFKAITKHSRALQRLHVEYVDIESIKPNSYNPNRQSEHDFTLLILSMQEDGFTQPIIVQRETREIVDGEHRWRAARHLSLRTVPVVLVDQTPEQMRLATLQHNRARGSEDIDLAIQVLRDLRELGALDWAQSSLMLDDAELQRLLDDVSVPDALAGELYSAGWEPTRAPLEVNHGDKGGEFMSDEARVRTKQLQARLAETEAPAQRAQIAAEIHKGTYRLACVYAGDEARFMHSLLREQPAQMFLQLCTEYAALEM